MYVYAPVVSVPKKQIIPETQNFAFNICIICKYYLKFFMAIKKMLRVEGHTKNCYTVQPMDEISCYYILMYLDDVKCNQIRIHI